MCSCVTVARLVRAWGMGRGSLEWLRWHRRDEEKDVNHGEAAAGAYAYVSVASMPSWCFALSLRRLPHLACLPVVVGQLQWRW